jgi:hypothetical protein
MKFEGSTKSKVMLTKIGNNPIRDSNNDGLIWVLRLHNISLKNWASNKIQMYSKTCYYKVSSCVIVPLVSCYSFMISLFIDTIMKYYAYKLKGQNSYILFLKYGWPTSNIDELLHVT